MLPAELTTWTTCGPKACEALRADTAAVTVVQMVDKLQLLYIPESIRRETRKSAKSMRYVVTRHAADGEGPPLHVCRMTSFERYGRTILYPQPPVDADHLWFKEMLGMRGIHPMWGTERLADRFFGEVDIHPSFHHLDEKRQWSAIRPWLVVLNDLTVAAGTRLRVHVLSSTGGFWLQIWFDDTVTRTDLGVLWNVACNLTTWRIEGISPGNITGSQCLGTELLVHQPDVTIASGSGCRTWGSPSGGSDQHSRWLGSAMLGFGSEPHWTPVPAEAQAQWRHTLGIQPMGAFGPLIDHVITQFSRKMRRSTLPLHLVIDEMTTGLAVPPLAAEDSPVHPVDGDDAVLPSQHPVELFGTEANADHEHDERSLLPNSITFTQPDQGDPPLGPGSQQFTRLARLHVPQIDHGDFGVLIGEGRLGRLVAHAKHLGLLDAGGYWVEDVADAIVGACLTCPTEEQVADVRAFVRCCGRQIEAGQFPFEYRPNTSPLPAQAADACWLMGHLIKQDHPKHFAECEPATISRLLEEIVRCQLTTGRLNYALEPMIAWCGWVSPGGSVSNAVLNRMRRLHQKVVVDYDGPGTGNTRLLQPLLRLVNKGRPKWGSREGSGSTYVGLWENWEDPIPALVGFDAVAIRGG